MAGTTPYHSTYALSIEQESAALEKIMEQANALISNAYSGNNSDSAPFIEQEFNKRKPYTENIRYYYLQAKNFLSAIININTLEDVHTLFDEINRTISLLNNDIQSFASITSESIDGGAPPAHQIFSVIDKEIIQRGLALCSIIFEKIKTEASLYKNLYENLTNEGQDIFNNLQERAHNTHGRGQEVALRYILSLPFGKYSKKDYKLKTIKDMLDADHHGLEKVKEAILDYLAAYAMKQDSLPPVICLIGPPGIGKTSIAESIAKALGRSHTRIALGSIHDVCELVGFPNTYESADAGMLIKALRAAGSMDPVLVLDEIDKVPEHTYRGNLVGTLLELLNPKQSKTFCDRFIEIPVDFSRVFFIATANDESAIPEPLRDRMHIIRIPSYTDQEKLVIAQQHLVKAAIKNIGLENHDLYFDDILLYKIITDYTHEAGVRELSRAINTLCSKIARSIIEENTVPTITADNLDHYLGISKFKTTHQDQTDPPSIGKVYGLAATRIGGVVLPIETVIKPGKGNIEITGRMGETMHESVRVALSYLHAHWKIFGIAENALEKIDVHVHAPDGGTPKDGPSAGITIAVALLSSLTNRLVDPNYAMTGEIDLHGRVGAVGCIREKVLAAKQYGLKNVIIPAANSHDLQEYPELSTGMTITLVNNAQEVFDCVLLPKKTCTKHQKSCRHHQS